MRTTVTLDDDLVGKLKHLAVRKGMSFKAALNAALRRGLASGDAGKKGSAYRVSTFRSAFRAGVDAAKLNQLIDRLEAERHLRR